MDQTLSAKIRFAPLPYVLIMDGEVRDDNLDKLGRNRFWLRSQLRQRGIRSFKSVYYCSIDRRGKLYIAR
ncbi:YetF domain-containing protein [Cohnella fermenti]|uniref:DUF421 domain-containing protein n=1 Tax=Cohnella fermenti TaxID=2565925 RepID=A0A4S4C7A8_9BACL|nr:YetF domain-containing protein [Cohnella fermenti]THF83828.1 DUF421 domain-containing protein [Cohnella fermenti]